MDRPGRRDLSPARSVFPTSLAYERPDVPSEGGSRVGRGPASGRWRQGSGAFGRRDACPTDTGLPSDRGAGVPPAGSAPYLDLLPKTHLQTPGWVATDLFRRWKGRYFISTHSRDC